MSTATKKRPAGKKTARKPVGRETIRKHAKDATANAGKRRPVASAPVNGKASTNGKLDPSFGPDEKQPNKKRGRPVQARIPETFDPVPDELQEVVDDYTDKLRERMELQKEEDSLRKDVIEAMKTHDVERVPLSKDEDKFLELDPGHASVHIKKRKKIKPPKDEAVTDA